MKLPVSWLNDYVDVSDLSIQELADKLTSAGVEVEGIETTGAVLDDQIVVGEVLTCVPHPDSDHMHVCQVTDGTTTFQVVCGAPNVREGLKTPFAKLGAYIPGGDFKIVPRKLRGVESSGMLCAADELKISDDHAGIMELDASIPVGTLMNTLVPKPESVLDLEITWNRPDCLSIIGIAREFAAILHRPVKLPPVDFPESGEDVNQYAKVRVEDPVKCPRYTARVLTHVQDGKSPDWMAHRLQMCGVRSISLTVDVTNYVMLECGQPLHAFDYRTLTDSQIVVRCAKEGEKIRTLDGAERSLDPSMLLICDAEKPSAVAGVMGGEGSEIEAGTENVLIESALFDPPSTKATATKLGMGTESSYRFIRGVDTGLADWASRRAVHLLVKYGNAVAAKGVIDVDNRNPAPIEVTLRFDRARQMIGVPIDTEEMITILTELGLEVTSREETKATFLIPSWRLDLTLEADLIEEIARLHGLDQIPNRMPNATAVSTLDDKPFYRKARAREILLGMGFSEAMHYSFLSQKELDAFDNRDAKRRVVLPNPVSAEYGVLRDSLLPQLSESLGRNASRQVEKAGLFEIGRVFFADPKGNPHEEEKLSIGLMGPFGRSALDSRRPVSNEECMLWMKGAVEGLVTALHAGTLSFQLLDHPAFEQGWSVEIKLNNQKIGILGLAKKALRHPWRMTSPMALCELRLSALLKNTETVGGNIQPPPQFPESRRDVAFLANDSVLHSQIVDTIQKAGKPFLADVQLFDTFTSKQLGKGVRSVAYTMSFRAPDRTLKDEEVNAAFQKILQALKTELSVTIREQ